MEAQQLSEILTWFDRFVVTFRAQSPEDQRNYDLKIDHTRRVRSCMERLATSLRLPPEDRALAEAIAICHDVGRFPQYRDYGTFNDTVSVNHATLAVQTLRSEKILDSLAAERRRLLLQAVAMHNAFCLPEELEPICRRFVMLIRDADKLDIWRVLIEYFATPSGERASAVLWSLPETGVCSARALEEVQAGRLLNRSLLKSADDFKLLQLSWVFDLNFAESFAMVAERGYIETLSGLLPDQPGCREAVDVVRNFVRSRE